MIKYERDKNNNVLIDLNR